MLGGDVLLRRLPRPLDLVADGSQVKGEDAELTLPLSLGLERRSETRLQRDKLLPQVLWQKRSFSGKLGWKTKQRYVPKEALCRWGCSWKKSSQPRRSSSSIASLRPQIRAHPSAA